MFRFKKTTNLKFCHSARVHQFVSRSNAFVLHAQTVWRANLDLAESLNGVVAFTVNG